jgi:hypothetical protein
MSRLSLKVRESRFSFAFCCQLDHSSLPMARTATGLTAKTRANKRTQHAWRVAVFFLIVATPTLRARADWRIEAGTSGLYDSNLSNSDRESDRKDDWAWVTNVLFANGWQLTRDLRLSVGGDFRGEVWSQYDSFNAIGGGALATVRYRFGLGSQAPWIALEERIGYDRFQEEDWSGWDELVRLRGGVSLSQRIALEVDYTFENISARDNFFSRQSNSIHFRAIGELTSAWQLAIGYTYRQGDVISYAVPSRPDIFAVAQTVRPGVTTFGSSPLYNAYRLVGHTHSMSILTSYAITTSMSVRLSYEYAVTLRDPLRYQNHRVQAQIGFAY